MRRALAPACCSRSLGRASCRAGAARRARLCDQMQAPAGPRRRAAPAACCVVDAGSRASRLRAGGGDAAAAGLEHEAVHDLDRAGPARAGIPGSPPRCSATASSTPMASCTAASTCRAAATRRLARPAFYDSYLGGLGTNLLRPDAADPRGGHPRGHRPALRGRHDLRPPARGRRLRLRDQPLHRPALRPLLRLRLRAARPPQRLRLRPGQARRLDAGPGPARRRASASRPGRPGHDARRAPSRSPSCARRP